MSGPTLDEHDHPPIDPADLDAGERHGQLLLESFKQAQTRSVAVFDQLLAHLRDLERSMDHVTGSMALPGGLRIELVKAASRLVTTAVLGLDEECDPSNERRDAHTEAIDVINALRRYAVQKRLENRVRDVACTLDLEVEEYELIASDDARLAKLAQQAGWNPPVAKIRTWLLRTVAKERERR